jgi:DNA-binding MarR family transcriptional regulator
VDGLTAPADLAPTDPAPAHQQLGRVLKRAEQTLLRAKSAALKPAGLTLAQYVALTELRQQPGITGASLARACLVTPQAMMVVLKLLEEQGLIARSPHPRHPNVLEVHITDAGHEALHEARQRVEPVERRVLAAFAPEELDVLGALLTRWIEAVEAG